jgi:dimethylglycine dehydrogenase
MLTPQGRILGEVTVARLSPEQFLLIGSPFAEALYLRWLQANVGRYNVAIGNWGGTLHGFAVTGPAAHDLLANATRDDVSDEAFPLLTARRLLVGMTHVLALRVSYTGERGYELYTAPDGLRTLYRTLIREGSPFELAHFGVRALNSLRMEKGYGAWGREYSQEYTAAEAGLGRLVAVNEREFIGHISAARQLSCAPQRKLALLAIDSHDPDPAGGEPVLYEGKPVGRLTSGAYGHIVGHALGFAYLPEDILRGDASLQVDLPGGAVPARLLKQPPYDPKGLRLRK